MGGHAAGIKGVMPRLDRDRSDAGDRVTGVDAEIRKNLIHLQRIDLHRPQVCPRGQGKPDILADKPLQHLENFGDLPVQIKDHGGDDLFTGKGQQLPGQLGGVHSGVTNPLQVGLERTIRLRFHQPQICMAEDDPQHIVEIVRHTSRQLADRFGLLGLEQLIFEPGPLLLRPLPLGNVLNPADGIEQPAGVAANGDEVGVGPDDPPVLADVALFHAELRDLAGVQLVAQGQSGVPVVGVQQVGCPARENFLLAEAEEVPVALVGQGELPLLAQQDDADGGFLEELAKASLARFRRFLGPFARGDVQMGSA